MAPSNYLSVRSGVRSTLALEPPIHDDRLRRQAGEVKVIVECTCGAILGHLLGAPGAEPRIARGRGKRSTTGLATSIALTGRTLPGSTPVAELTEWWSTRVRFTCSRCRAETVVRSERIRAAFARGSAAGRRTLVLGVDV